MRESLRKSKRGWIDHRSKRGRKGGFSSHKMKKMAEGGPMGFPQILAEKYWAGTINKGLEKFWLSEGASFLPAKKNI